MDANEPPALQTDSEITYAQFKALANSIPNLAWMADKDGWLFWYNQRWYDYTGTTPEEMMGWGWQSVHHPDVLPEMLERWTGALRSGQPFEMTFPLRRGSDGSYRTFVTRAEPLREDGEIVGWFGTNTDITEQELTRERLQLVINELNHRVKNTLATVQSLAYGSFRGADSDALTAFERRLLSLARMHDLLTRDRWSATPLDEVVQSAIGTFDEHRFDLELCDRMIEPRVVSALGMTLHELATNAVKYGALSVDGGRVRIDCRIEAARGGERLLLEWRESGGPPVSPPAADGFGVKLIKRVMAGERGASVEHLFEPGGVVCRIAVPLSAELRA
ncbi:MAG: sensor histidine kinase [Cypionkella sp.]